MSISAVIKEEQVIIDLDANSRDEALRIMSGKLKEHEIISDVDEFIQVVLERETHSTTGIGLGIAIPHGKSGVVTESAVVIAKSQNELEWDSLDGEPVNLIFLLAIPTSDEGGVHLKTLSELAQKLLDDEFVDQLKLASDAKTIINLLQKGED